MNQVELADRPKPSVSPTVPTAFEEAVGIACETDEVMRRGSDRDHEGELVAFALP